jgi:hypothetical protein
MMRPGLAVDDEDKTQPPAAARVTLDDGGASSLNERSSETS